ncbi:hypothetical protein M4S82_15640 [Planococcus sp. MERTA32b]|nr:hypothetical protein [Planococcus sp. MER TA 32b]
MKVYQIIFTLSALLLLLTGCIESEASKSNGDTEKAIEESIQEFSYLDDLTEEEREAYQHFMENKDINHLKGFTPEKIVLVYLHSVANSDTEGIYSLTYHNGKSPELYEFENEYPKERQLKDEDLALKFRNYDSILSKEDAVNMKISFGSISYSLFIGVKKEDDIWKVNKPK